jgi:hypothetical protein
MASWEGKYYPSLEVENYRSIRSISLINHLVTNGMANQHSTGQ